MTDATTAQSVAEEISEVANSLENQQEELEEFELFLNEAEDRISSLDPNKRQAFYESVDDLRSEIADVETVASLLALREEIEEAIKSPLKEAALDAFDEFINEIEVDIGKGDEADLRDSIRNSVQSELEDMAKTYHSLSSQVADYPPYLKHIIAHRIESQPSSIINERAELSADIEKLRERHENLDTIQSRLDQVTFWAPSGDLTEQEKFYEDLDYSLSVDPIQNNISVIDAKVEDLEDAGLSIADPVQNKFEEDLKNGNVTGLSRVIESLRDDINSISHVFDEVQTYATALESFGRDRDMFGPQIDELLAETEQLTINKYRSVSAVREEIAQLQSEYEDFLDSVGDRLRAQREMVEELSAEFEDRNLPSVPETISSEESLFNSVVHEYPLDALEACVTYDSWVEERFGEIEGSFETERAMEIWGQLYEGESVSLTKENENEILALANRFTLSVGLGSE
jgi:uncharacterized protein YoxC